MPILNAHINSYFYNFIKMNIILFNKNIYKTKMIPETTFFKVFTTCYVAYSLILKATCNFYKNSGIREQLH